MDIPQEEDDFKDPWLEPDKPAKGKGKGKNKDKDKDKDASAAESAEHNLRGMALNKDLRSTPSEPVDTVAAAAQVAAKMQASGIGKSEHLFFCFISTMNIYNSMSCIDLFQDEIITQSVSLS